MQPVVIIGHGPAGTVLALYLAKNNIPVVLIEKTKAAPRDMRASTFHPPTIEMLHALGLSEAAIAKGLKVEEYQYRDRKRGDVATFDMRPLKKETDFPFRLQLEQWEVVELGHAELKKYPHVEIRMSTRLCFLQEHAAGVTVTCETLDDLQTIEASYVIGADGAHSTVRKLLKVGFDGFKYDERFLVVATEFQFEEHFPNLSHVNYQSDPDEWCVLLKTDKNWRVLVPEPIEEGKPRMTREELVGDEFVQARLQHLLPRDVPYTTEHRSLYEVNQRVAETFFKGRCALVGDACHVHNPLGGMGMNGGCHDAWMVGMKLVEILKLGKDHTTAFREYDAARRVLAQSFIQKHTIENKKTMESKDPEFQRKRQENFNRLASDPKLNYDFVFERGMFDLIRKSFGVTHQREYLAVPHAGAPPAFAPPARLSDPDWVVLPDCRAVVQALRALWMTDVTRPIEWRVAALDRLGCMLRENIEAISQAQRADHVRVWDFTGRHNKGKGSMRMIEGALMFYKASVGKWAAPRSVDETLPPPMQTPEWAGEWVVEPEPKGVGLVIAPWNAPVLLCFLPCMGMLAAGNVCVLKPSDLTPKVSALLADLVPKYFPDKTVVVQEGGPDVVKGLIEARVDHVLFTGGGAVAEKVLALCAPTLTPVTLELGGKNPCFIDQASPAELEAYVAEIIGTKDVFGGMFCQCHDYLLVHEKVFDQVAELVERYIGKKTPIQLIHARHAQRVKALLQGQEDKCRPPLQPCADDECCLVAVLEPAADSAIMKEEIFGPLLPLLKVSGAAEAVAFARARPAPLVAYCYSPDRAAWELFERVQAGNLAINCGPMRMTSNLNVGFGGVGGSGFGHSLWGKSTFDDLSHHKPSFRSAGFAGSVWAPKQVPKVKVVLSSGAGETFGVDDIAVACATSAGLWEREGLDVEWIPARGGVKALEKVLSGEAQVAYGTFAPVIAAAGRGEKVKVFASMARGLAQKLVVRKDRVPSVDQLRGARWAVDGIGALSHNLAALVVEALQTEVEYVVAGPPPERIAQVLDGRCDVALVRVEEAAALAREHQDTLHVLLGFEDLQRLAPKQPHGVLSTTSAFAAAQPEVCHRLTRGLLAASRLLHDDYVTFHQAVRYHVKHVTPTDEEIRAIWQTEHDAGSFAVNGGVAGSHWAGNLEIYATANPAAPTAAYADFVDPSFVQAALDKEGLHAEHDPAP